MFSGGHTQIPIWHIQAATCKQSLSEVEESPKFISLPSSVTRRYIWSTQVNKPIPFSAIPQQNGHRVKRIAYHRGPPPPQYVTKLALTAILTFPSALNSGSFLTNRLIQPKMNIPPSLIQWLPDTHHHLNQVAPNMINDRSWMLAIFKPLNLLLLNP
jgi:hypothetical protein